MRNRSLGPLPQIPLIPTVTLASTGFHCRVCWTMVPCLPTACISPSAAQTARRSRATPETSLFQVLPSKRVTEPVLPTAQMSLAALPRRSITGSGGELTKVTLAPSKREICPLPMKVPPPM